MGNILEFIQDDHSCQAKHTQELRSQIIKIGLGLAPWQTKPIEKDSQRAILEDFLKMKQPNAHTFVQRPFERKKRANTIVDNDQIIAELDEFLETNTELCIRANETTRVPGNPEPVRRRIVQYGFNQLFSFFNGQRVSNGQAVVSHRSLYVLAEKHLPQYQKPRVSDKQFAECVNCIKIEVLLRSMQRNEHLKAWEIDQDKLLQLSVCSDKSKECLWNRCPDCHLFAVVNRIKENIPNYDDVKGKSVAYRVLTSYNKNGSSTGSKSTIWLPRNGSIEEFVPVLAEALFCHASKATGSKVRTKDHSKY